MNNQFTLTAVLNNTETVRYSPAGVPILEVLLKHESWQTENGQKCLVSFELPAKIIGEQALQWQNRQQVLVEVSGFLAQKSRKYPKPILRIQNIQEYKG
ncbi:MAG: primosomal replication protein N [Neisseria sp.]|nr:primosomal replication protein N [Neisseria sp.]